MHMLFQINLQTETFSFNRGILYGTYVQQLHVQYIRTYVYIHTYLFSTQC